MTDIQYTSISTRMTLPRRRFGAFAPDISELVRTSCKRLSESSKYIDINYDFLEEYAHTAFTQFPPPKSLPQSTDLSESNRINMCFLSVMLQWGYNPNNTSKMFRSMHAHQNSGGFQSIVAKFVTNLYKKYHDLSVKTLSSLSIDDVAELSEIGRGSFGFSGAILQCIHRIVNNLKLKQFNDFAEYVYCCIDLAWIKSQTDDLSAIKTIEFELNETGPNTLGLTFAPTKSKVIRRCVITNVNPANMKQMECYDDCMALVQSEGFLYAVQDTIVYKKPFSEIIQIIKDGLASAPMNKNGKRSIALQFGEYLNREPDIVQTLLFNIIHDFSGLNDQCLYKQFYGTDKHLKVYFFQCAQSIVMELYQSMFLSAAEEDRNTVFNFKDIDSLTAVVDNLIPFVLLQDGVIKIKAEFAKEFDSYMNGSCVVKRSDLEVEMMASAVHAMELLVNFMPANMAQLACALKHRAKDLERRPIANTRSV